MSQKKREFMTIGQIDATGIRGPHEKELEDIGKNKIDSFKDIEFDELNKIVKDDLGGVLENIGFNEDWTITIEMFPDVVIHIAYTYFGDEFGDGIEAEFKFYFSGQKVSWVPGEDSATYIDIIMDFLERRIKETEVFERNYDQHTELMEKVLKQRTDPFRVLKSKDKKALSDFLGAKIWQTAEGWRIKRELLPEIYAEIIWDHDAGLDISFSGENLENIGSYHIELLGIFTINHILRFITIEYETEELPDICYIMFSRYFTKEKNWEHRRA